MPADKFGQHGYGRSTTEQNRHGPLGDRFLRCGIPGSRMPQHGRLHVEGGRLIDRGGAH